MSVQQMRVELEKKYSKSFIAIYRRLQSQNKI